MATIFRPQSFRRQSLGATLSGFAPVLPFGFQLRRYHNAQEHPEAVTVIEFPKELATKLASMVQTYIDTEIRVNNGQAVKPKFIPTPYQLIDTAFIKWRESPLTDKNQAHEFEEKLDDYRLDRKPAVIFTGLPVKPIKITDEMRINTQSARNILKRNPDYNYNILLQDSVLAYLGIAHITTLPTTPLIYTHNVIDGAYNSKKGMPWHIDYATKPYIPKHVSLMCINGGTDITRLMFIKRIFDALPKDIQEELCKPQFFYKHDNAPDGKTHAIFTKDRNGRLDMTYTREQEVSVIEAHTDIAAYKALDKLNETIESLSGTLQTLQAGLDTTGMMVIQRSNAFLHTRQPSITLPQDPNRFILRAYGDDAKQESPNSI